MKKFNEVNRMNVKYTILVMLILALSMVHMPVGEGELPPREFNTVHINMKANDIFNPEYEHDNETEPTVKRVQAEYSSTPISRSAEWADAGTWDCDTIKGPMTVQGTVSFNLWYQIVDEGYTGEPDWQFDLKVNGEVIAHAQADNTPAEKDSPTQMSTSGNIAEPVDVSAGDIISLSIQYRHVEDVDLFYDTIDYESGALVEMDSILIIKADSSSVTFFDAWGFNWDLDGKYFCSLNYGGWINQGDEETEVYDAGPVEGDNGTTYETVRIKYKNIQQGNSSNVSFSIRYGPTKDSGEWTFEPSPGSIKDEKEEGISVIAVGGTVVVLGIIGAILFMYKNKAESEGDDEYEYEEYDDESEEEGEEFEDEEEEE